MMENKANDETDQLSTSELYAGQITQLTSSVATNVIGKIFRALVYMKPELKC